MALAAVERSARFSSLAAASDARNRRQRVASRGFVPRHRSGSAARRRSAQPRGRLSHRVGTASASDDVVGASGSLRASTRARIFTRSTAPRPGYEVSRRSEAADRRATPHARRCWAPRTPTANDLFDSLVRRRPVTVGDAELGAPPRGPIRPPDAAHPSRERPGGASGGENSQKPVCCSAFCVLPYMYNTTIERFSFF